MTQQADEQLSFPWGLTADEVVKRAEKQMAIGTLTYSVCVFRWIQGGVWVVGKWVPVVGPSGYIGAAYLRLSPHLFFKGKEAWRFAKANIGMYKSHQEFPWVDQTMQ